MPQLEFNFILPPEPEEPARRHGMTRREKLERKLERREAWAAAARERANEEFDKSHKAVENIPFGQPILVGHHSEAAHRAALDRSWSAMGRGAEETHRAEHHEEKARGLARQLATNIYSDDDDALEKLEAKIKNLEELQERMKAANKRERGSYPSWALTNNGANIRRLKQRMEEIRQRNERKAGAEANGGVNVVTENGWCVVTFAEFPGRTVINDLKAAGFFWRGGSWRGDASKLPEPVKNMAAGE